ncbi:MAG: hypothetical protein ACYTBS_11210 [Planctomycetota bacterium]
MLVTNGNPDRESDFQIVIRISIGAGESEEIRSALAWGVSERRREEIFDPYEVDRYWDQQNASTTRDGHSMYMLAKTKSALEKSLLDAPVDSSAILPMRRTNIERGIALVEKALRLALKAASILASKHAIADLTAD